VYLLQWLHRFLAKSYSEGEVLMKTKCWFFTKLAFVLWVACTFSVVKALRKESPGQTSSHEQQARQILDATGAKGGLVVHIGCGDGKLTAALRVNDSYLVHGLDTKAKNVEKAREHIKSLSLYGSVSVELLMDRHLHGRGYTRALTERRGIHQERQ